MTSLLRPRRAPRGAAALRAAALGATSAAAATGFGMLARASARRETAAADEAIRASTAPPEGHPVRNVAAAIAPAGKWYVYAPLAVGIAGWVLMAGARPSSGRTRRRRRRAERELGARIAGAGAIVLSSAVAATLGPVFDRWLPQPPPPPGRESRTKPVFPSGHALGPAAVGLASAWVLARERLLHPAIGLPLALGIPLVTAGSRMAEEKHWASDVAGGYLAGAAVAAGCAAIYEGVKGPRRSARR